MENVTAMQIQGDAPTDIPTDSGDAGRHLRRPWRATDRERALGALAQRHQSLQARLHNAHCCPGPGIRSCQAHERDKECLAASREAMSATTATMRQRNLSVETLSEFGATMVQVNARLRTMRPVPRTIDSFSRALVCCRILCCRSTRASCRSTSCSTAT